MPINLELFGIPRWESVKIESHNVGCNAVSWAPALQNKRFVTGGCDNLVKIWKFDEETQKWINEHTLEGHTDWVSYLHVLELIFPSFFYPGPPLDFKFSVPSFPGAVELVLATALFKPLLGQ